MKKLGTFLFRYRSYTPLPFLAVLLFFAQPTVASMLVGLMLVAGGEALRLWANGYTGSETRTTSGVGASQLVVRGPYAHVRNPLYIGNMIIYVGTGIMANALLPWLPLAAVLFFGFQYSLIIRREEEFLAEAFGETYMDYCRQVWRWIPRFRPYAQSAGEQPNFSWQRAWQTERRTLQAIVVVVMVLAVMMLVGKREASTEVMRHRFLATGAVFRNCCVFTENRF
ncbi:MAG: isoprenylcysteine carboxylmethyltransferase family protein [Chitinophagales bacterium]|nr:isoprenylcysteine carboxylmethyltransferase family protein [Chitinophagales bacterium]MDW8428110.1 isoprenylcysteine carboxylmethyltransferase family protein [Chitinophagales bacterium]